MDPSTRTKALNLLYPVVRNWLLRNDPDAGPMYEWAGQVARPDSPERSAGEIIWIILCAGRSAQAARTIERKVWEAINEGRPVVEAFGYRKKAEAIDRAWHERHSDFSSLRAIPDNDIEAVLAWCESLPYVGATTKYQLAKNFGYDVCKPDLWLRRLAGVPEATSARDAFRACQALCEHIADKSGDRVAIVDTLLWLACNKAVLRVEPTTGHFRFTTAHTKAPRGLVAPENQPAGTA